MEKLLMLLLLVSLPFSKGMLPATPCIGADRNSCLAKLTYGSPSQCCWVKSTFNNESINEFCAPSINPTPDISPLMSLKFDAIFQEAISFALYGKVSIIGNAKDYIDKFINSSNSININLQCQDEKGFDISYETVSDADKKKLNDENHCLYLAYKSLLSKNSQFECKNGILTDKVTNQGFSCGYYDFKIENQGNIIESKTCFLFNKEIYSKLNKDNELSRKINSIFKTFTNNSYKFSVNIYDGKGNKFLYESTNTSLIQVNRSNFIIVSKILLLLSLLLI